MHILWTPSWFPSDRNPANGSFFSEQLKMLNDANLQCGAIVLEPSSLGEQLTPFSVSHEPFPVIRTGFKMIPKGIVPIEGFLIAQISRKCARIYEKNYGKPDIIHAHSVWPGIIVAQNLAKYWNIPYVFTEHRPSTFSIRKHSNRGRLIHKAVINSDDVITVSTGMAELLASHYNLRRVHTIPLPVRNDFFNTPLSLRKNHTFNFLHISNLDDNKRTLFTIDVFSEHHQIHPNSNLIIAGGANKRVDELKNYVERLGLSKAIIFKGQVPRDSIIEIYQEADCLILVSAVESAGAVFAEAAAMGIPAVASSTFGGSFMVTSETGIVVPVDAKEETKNAMLRIKHLIESGELSSNHIREEAYARFSESSFVDTHKQIYSNCIESHPVNL